MEGHAAPPLQRYGLHEGLTPLHPTGATKQAIRVARNKDKPDASLSAENCMVSGCTPGDIEIGKHGNLEGEASFVDAAKDDYRIKPDSAAAGKGKAVPEVTEDAAGKARPKDAPAIGAYEPVKE